MDDHPFTFPEIRPGAGSNMQPYTHFFIFFRKRADSSKRYFMSGGEATILNLYDKSIDGYWLHTLPEYKEEFEKYGMEPLQLDGMARYDQLIYGSKIEMSGH
ncbi:hypothetical protein CC80DRAFT_555417 [Byssothecium circinans]|uniref:Uncharacterized protein n=1 Tax=Byssothecium circinans TaxID=147558 RepID=A0A6A5TAT8_9PLEO|nr:hypothetical protein CC80DRAFT_555417 [Byssothecium circinans]